MKGFINIDDTDFKQGVAYLFELRKSRWLVQKLQEKNVTENTIADLSKSEKSNDLFEDFQFPEFWARQVLYQ